MNATGSPRPDAAAPPKPTVPPPPPPRRASDRLIPQAYPLAVRTADGDQHLVVAWRERDGGTLVPVTILDQADATAQELDTGTRADWWYLPAEGERW